MITLINSVGMFGAVGDGVADDGPAIRAAIDYSTPGSSVVLLKGRVHIARDTITLKTGVTLDLNGGTLRFILTTTEQYALQLRSFTRVVNGTVDMVGTGYDVLGSGGDHQVPIIIGSFFGGGSGPVNVGYEEIVLSGLTITSNRDSGLGIGIASNSHNILIENIKFPSSSTMTTCIAINPGTDGLNPPVAMTHPFDIKIRNIGIGNMTGVVANPGFIASPIILSGCYSVHIENVQMERCGDYSAVYVSPGSYGFTRADSTIQRLGMQGIVIDSVHCKLCPGEGVFVNGWAASVPLTIISAPIRVQNCRLHGSGVANTHAGLRFLKGWDATFENCHVDSFNYGALIDESAKRCRIIGGSFVANNLSGIFIGHASQPEDCAVIRAECYRNGTNGVHVDGSLRTIVDSCLLGHQEGANETTQTGGVRCGGTDSVVRDCFVRSVAGAGIGYHFESIPYLFSNCGANPTFVPAFRTGVDYVPIARSPRGGQFVKTNWVGIGNPNGAVTGSRGDMFNRTDGGVGTSLYVKEVTDGDQVNWAAK